MTDDGYFRFLFLESSGGRNQRYRIHYVTYDVAGQLLFHHEPTDFMLIDLNHFTTIEETVFTPAGDVIFRAFSDGSFSISIVDQAGVISSELEARGRLVQLRDGRIALFYRRDGYSNLIILTPDLPD